MRQDASRWLSAPLTCLSLLLLQGPARAAVVWTSTFEKGDLSEWQPGVNDTKGTRKNVEVLGEQVYTGKFACKVTVHPDDTFTFGQNRVDIQHPSTLTAEGKELWLSGHYMMPADAQTRDEIAFFESNVSFQNIMDFWVAPKTGGGTTITYGVGDLGATKLWTGDFKAGVWHQVAIHVLWSTNAQVGMVDVWFDGVQVVTAAKAKTKPDNNTLFFQTGLHRISDQPFTEVIYFNDFVEADNFADAKIAPPIGPDGGTEADASTGATDGGTIGADGSGGAGSGGATNAGGAGGASGATSAGGATVTGTGSTTSGGTGGTSGTSTTGATSGVGGAAVTTGPSTTGPGAVPGDANSPSGCSCSVLGDKPSKASWAFLAGILGATIVARRRRTLRR